ncbi:MAG: GMC family oxidoreductase [Acetobacteraceae bacterium]|nr:GMC family oxidoreductase [Acetobacteraceae bacterium]
MIGDARRIVRDAVLTADICIVGGGAAGIALALRLRDSGLRVLLLESGGPSEDKATQALYEGEVADEALHSPPDKYRQRRFGGSTTIWGGRCVPFDPIDFDARPWMPYSGWPISHETVARWYPEANALVEAGACDYDARTAREGGLRPVIAGFNPREFDVDRIERFSCPTDFARRYRHRLETTQQVRVLLQANVTRLRTSADGARVDSAEVRTLDGNRFQVQADQFVVATGGLETPRLLLASNDVHAAGIGNARDLLGRFYMSHIAGTMGSLRLHGAAVWHGYDLAEDGTYCRRRIALSEEAQHTHALGNMVFRLHHPRIPDPNHRTGALSAIYLAKHLISYEYGKRLTGDGPVTAGLWLRHVGNLMTDPFGAARFLAHWVRHRTLAARKFPSVIIRPRADLFSLDFHAEQAPQPDSRVTLGHSVDAFGMPRLRVDWRYCELDVRTVATGFALLRQEFAESGLGELKLEPSESDIEAVVRRDGAYGGHHIGTVRMGDSRATGVVDANCRVFGVNNLYVAGSSVFPTSSQANPTLTLLALALRLADHLHARAARPIEVGQVPRVSRVGSYA